MSSAERSPSANDTSFGVGYAPLSETENIVFNTERELMRLKKSIPAIGEDIKVMGMRQGDVINLTIACAMVDQACGEPQGVCGHEERHRGSHH